MPVHSLSPALRLPVPPVEPTPALPVTDPVSSDMDIYQGTQVGQAPLSLVLWTSIATL